MTKSTLRNLYLREEPCGLMKEYRCNTLSRKTDLVACDFCHSDGVLNEWISIAPLLLLQSFCSDFVSLQDNILAGFVISRKQILYVLFHNLSV